jgi:hypothetical protein
VRHERQRGSARGQMQKLSSVGKFHGEPTPLQPYRGRIALLNSPRGDRPPQRGISIRPMSAWGQNAKNSH